LTPIEEGKMKPVFILCVTAIVFAASINVASAQGDDIIPQISSLRLSGQLAEAKLLAEESLSNSGTSFDRLRLHLELSRIHDRVGLHRNTRPVEAALTHINEAAAAAEPGHPESEALIELARADYYYRAEMAERRFPTAISHAERAIELFGQMGDRPNEAEAVHKLGLIEMQSGNLARARELFEQSLILDQEGGERIFFRGEYERHVGFVLLLQGDNESAIPFFERSLERRKESGAVDASMFAAATLASSLVNADRLDEAWPVIAYGMMVAQKIDSPVGMARIGLVQARLHAKAGDNRAARLAYEMTISVAESVASTSMAEQARTEMADLVD
jgi:tetratricopeptide (TPR) repeat protein